MEYILNSNKCNSVCNVETATQQLISQHLLCLGTILMEHSE